MNNSIGYNFVLGPRGTGYEAVRKARKTYECEGVAVDADAVDDGVQLSPGTGSIVMEGQSDRCSDVIKPGDLYVAQDYRGEHAQDFGAAYRYTFRTCLPCSLSSRTVQHALVLEETRGLIEGPTVEIGWYGKKKPIHMPLGDLAGIQNLIERSTSSAASITCEAVELLDLYEILRPLADPDLEEIEINGVTTLIATTTAGDYAFVPYTHSKGVEILYSSSASWLPGGPCVMEQHEMILRYRDLFWVDTSGDSENSRKIAGHFGHLDTGLTAAVALSTYCHLNSAGEITCELDEWGQEE